MSTEEEEDALPPDEENIDAPDVSFRNTITEKQATPSDRGSLDSTNEAQTPRKPQSKRGSDTSKNGASSPEARDPNGGCPPTKYIYIPAPAPYCMPTPIPMCSPMHTFQQPCQGAGANSCMYVVGTNPCWDVRKCCCPPNGAYGEAENGGSPRSYAPRTRKPTITQYAGDRQMSASPGRRTIVNQGMENTNGQQPMVTDAAYHVNPNAYRLSDGGGTYRNEYQDKRYHSQAPTGSIYQERVVHDSIAQTMDSQLPPISYDERKSQFRRQGVAHHIIPSRPTFAESVQSAHVNHMNTSGVPEKSAGVQVDPRQLYALNSHQQMNMDPGMVLGMPGMASNFEFNVKGDHTKTRFVSEEEQQTLNAMYEGQGPPDHDLRSGHHSDHGEHRKTILHTHSGHKHHTAGAGHKKSLSAKSSKSNLGPQTHEQSVSAKSSKSRLTPRSLSPPSKAGSSGRMTPSKTQATAQQTKGAFSKEQVVQTYGMEEVQVYDPTTGNVHYQKREQCTSTTDLIAFGNNQFVSQNGFSGYNNNAEFPRWDMDLDANFRAPMGNPYGRDMGMGLPTQGPYRDTNQGQCRSRTSCCYDRHGQLCKVVRPTTPPSLLGSSCGNPEAMFPDDGPCDAQSLFVKQKLEHQRRTMVIEQELQEQRQLLCLQKELLNQRQMFLMHQEMQYRKQASVLKKALNKARKDLVDCTRDARVRKPDPCENPCEEPRSSPRLMGGCSYRLVRNTGQIGFPASNCHHQALQRLGDNQCASSFTQGVPEPSDGVHVIKTGNVHAQYFLQTQGVSLSKMPNKVRMQYKPKERSNSCNKAEVSSATKIVVAKEASRESSTGPTNLV